MSAPFEASLAPLSIGGHTSRNRLVFLATRNNLGTNGTISDKQVQFYRERAAGGVGLIVTEGLAVHPSSIPNTTVPLAYARSLVSGFSHLADAVHEEGALVVGQLWHIGRQRVQGPAGIPWGASATPDPISGVVPHVMREDEVVDVITGYGRAAVNLRQAGFDGVEIHGAHGYLISEFLSPLTNARTDRWGGSMENRCGLLIAVIEAIRAATDAEFIIGLKITFDELQPGGLEARAMLGIIDHVERTAPPSYWAVSEGLAGTDLHRVVPSMDAPVAPTLHHARRVRAALRDAGCVTPVLALGKIPDLRTAAEAVRNEDADLIGMSRPLIADPALVRKSISGEPIRPCIYCNHCWDRTFTQRPIACVLGDAVDVEAEVESAPSGYMPAVHVIGAGAAGLEFARGCAQRGHQVTVFEASGRVGGWLAKEAEFPGRERLSVAVEWLEQSARDAGVRIITEQRITSRDVEGWGDVLVAQATGAHPILPGLGGEPDVMTLEDLPGDESPVADDVIVILDVVEDEPTYAAARWLVERGAEVHLVTRRGELAARVPYVSRIGIHEHLDRAGIHQHVLSEPVAAEGSGLRCRHVVSRREFVIDGVDRVVAAGPFESTPSLLRSLDGRGLILGDALAPRPLADVLLEARSLAQRLAVLPYEQSPAEIALSLDSRSMEWFAPPGEHDNVAEKDVNPREAPT